MNLKWFSTKKDIREIEEIDEYDFWFSIDEDE